MRECIPLRLLCHWLTSTALQIQHPEPILLLVHYAKRWLIHDLRLTKQAFLYYQAHTLAYQSHFWAYKAHIGLQRLNPQRIPLDNRRKGIGNQGRSARRKVMIGQHICSTATAETVYIDPEFKSNPQAEIPRQTLRSPSGLTPAVSLVLRDTLELSTQVIEKASVQASSCRCASLTLSTSLLLHFPYYSVLVRSHQLAKDNLSASLLRF